MNPVPLPRVAVGGLLGAFAAAAIAAPGPDLDPGDDATLALTLAARGVQVYECRDGRWAFVAPEAELFDTDGRPAGSHGAGPFWQARDGSRVVAAVKQRAAAPEAGAIPWLLLVATSDSPRAGQLAGISAIQRVNTRGGSAPDGACPSPGQVLRVPYTADYHFFRPGNHRSSQP